MSHEKSVILHMEPELLRYETTAHQLATTLDHFKVQIVFLVTESFDLCLFIIHK